MSGLPKRIEKHETGDNAVEELERQLPPKWIFRRLPQEKDYGVDGEIEVVRSDGSVLGSLLRVQLKGTTTPIAKKSTVYIGNSTARYLLIQPLPVLIVCHFASDNLLLWIEFKDHAIRTQQASKILEDPGMTTMAALDFDGAKSITGNAQDLMEIAYAHQLAVADMHVRQGDVTEQQVAAVCWYILATKFDGSLTKWITYLRTQASDSQLFDAGQAQFITRVIEEQKTNPDYVRDVIAKLNY